jgi:general secretion pathway protein I
MKRGAGFTLVEVLVALTIIAISLGAGLRAVSALTDRTLENELRLAALWSADNRLQEQFLANPFPNPGSSESECPQGRWALRCVQEVSPTRNAAIRKIVVAVWTTRDGQKERQVARLVGFGSSVPRK